MHYHETSFYPFPFCSARNVDFPQNEMHHACYFCLQVNNSYKVKLQNVELFIDSFRLLAGVCENSVLSPYFDRIRLFDGGDSLHFAFRRFPFVDSFTEALYNSCT
jgi:hypothetical protein